jgi:hypothetical protein
MFFELERVAGKYFVWNFAIFTLVHISTLIINVSMSIILSDKVFEVNK